MLLLIVGTSRRPLSGDDAAVVTRVMLSWMKFTADLVLFGPTHTAEHLSPADGGLYAGRTPRTSYVQ